LPGRVVVGVDARDGYVATHGWAEVSDMKVEELADRFADAGVAALLFTDVGRDGLLKGCNVDATVSLARKTRIPVPPSEFALADIESIEPQKHTMSPGAKVLVGIGSTVGVVFVLFAIALAGSR